MSADDNLNDTQFMPLHKIKKLVSNNSTSGMATVGQMLPRARRDSQYASVRDSMASVGQQEPLQVVDSVLVEGHHRAAAAEELGWKGLQIRRGF
jgi:hypothetical protein